MRERERETQESNENLRLPYGEESLPVARVMLIPSANPSAREKEEWRKKGCILYATSKLLISSPISGNKLVRAFRRLP